MSQFLTEQLDYIFFIYGLAFILLAASCSIMYRRESASKLPWHLLGLFGISHGVNEWLDMLALSLDNSSLFLNIRIAIMALSFVFLLEFGRRGLHALRGSAPGSWIYLPLIACMACAVTFGTAELNATIRYTLCLAGGLAASWALRSAAAASPSGSALSGAAVSMALYTVAAGLIVPKAGFFPANAINHTSFQLFTTLPVQLVRAAFAVACTYYVWRYHQLTIRQQIDATESDTGDLGFRTLIVGAALLAFGWLATSLFGKAMMQQMEDNILLQSSYAAAAINVDRIKNTCSNPGNEQSPDYLRIREQLSAFHKLNPRLHLMQLYTLKESTPSICVDSVSVDNIHHARPGTPAKDAVPELLDVFSSGMPRIVPPHRGIHGIFVSGLTPILEQGNPNILAVLGIEIDADNWQRSEARYRLLAIITTLIFSTFTVAFFVTRQRMLESARLLNASRNRYEEAQRERQRELEELNRTLEKQVEARTAKLTEINTELKHFAYIASHDLQEPLRTITSFIQLLAKRYQGKLDKDADDFIGFVTDGAKRMQNLINDLLAYSRVSSKAKPFTQVDSNRIMECTLANLRQVISESGVTITVDHLPTITGDETQILQLFQNLLANAIKFRSAQQPTVQVTCQELQDAWEYRFTDNGIGIDPKFHERIFEVFQRLHNREQYAGTGIGLAVCKKIVERHGGTIRVESEPDKGSSFIFRISKNPEQPGEA